MIRNGFIKKSVETLTLGEKLKKFRSDHRISLNEVSRHTRIQTKYLEYLENGEYNKLPVDVYVVGFIKSYAEFLGIDERVLIKMYEKEKGIKNNIDLASQKKVKHKNFPFKLPEPINISSFIFTPRIIIISVIAVLVLSGFIYIYREIGSFSSAPRLVILSPEQNASVNGNSVVIEGITDRDAKLFVNDQPILVNDDGKFQENISIQAGENVIKVKAVNRFEKEEIKTLTVRSDFQEVNNDTAASPENSNGTSAPTAKIEVEIRVDPGPVWLSVEADDSLVYSGTMLTGALQNFSADKKIVINSGRANATFVKFNGKDIGAIGPSANPIRGVTFNSDTRY